MRFFATAMLGVFAWSTALGAPPRAWRVEVEWGDSIPAGTGYKVAVTGDGTLSAERSGLPFTADGKLTTVSHKLSLSVDEAVSFREAVERCIRSVDLTKAQGAMAGDGGYVHLYLWDGTVALAAKLERLISDANAGEPTEALIRKIKSRLPAGFQE